MRKCPFWGCGQEVPDSMFACRKHWFSLNAAEKAEVWDAYRDYQANRIGVEELRQRQQAVLGTRGTA